MNILFLDQSGNLGGAELCLADIAQRYRPNCLVGVFGDGTFPERLRQQQIPVQVLRRSALAVTKSSGVVQGVASLVRLLPLVGRVAQLSNGYDLIYANTQKALVVGALASLVSDRPLVYHLHDIVSPDHFSATNRRIIITLANRCATLVIANSEATKEAFIAAGGDPNRVQVVYNGFQPDLYQRSASVRSRLRTELGLGDRLVVGHFSRLSPWKGQHVLVEALLRCPEHVVVLLVGDALFGEQDYVVQLRRYVVRSGLTERVKFLGFRSDIPDLMAACDLIAHTSIAPEPFGRVIVEGMLCQRPVVAAAAGGATELIRHGETGWLTPAGDAQKLAEIILTCCNEPDRIEAIARVAQAEASQRFHLDTTNQQIEHLLQQVSSHRIYPYGDSVNF